MTAPFFNYLRLACVAVACISLASCESITGCDNINAMDGNCYITTTDHNEQEVAYVYFPKGTELYISNDWKVFLENAPEGDTGGGLKALCLINEQKVKPLFAASKETKVKPTRWSAYLSSTNGDILVSDSYPSVVVIKKNGRYYEAPRENFLPIIEDAVRCIDALPATNIE